MSNITQILNWISSSLLLPVIVLLLLTMLAALISLGGFCTMYLNLLRERSKRTEIIGRIKSGQRLDEEILYESGIFATHLAELSAVDWDEIDAEKHIAEIQQGYERELEKAKFITKVAPMLGLMGTLIPMGPALAQLASGDIANMAYNMQIAFATTVVGCLSAGIALMVYSAKKHWYTEEITNLRYVLDRHLAGRM